MDNLNNMLDIMLLICFAAAGIYSLYTAIVMGGWETLRPNKMLYPSGCRPEACLDPEGFLLYQRPRVVVFGLVALISAGAFGVGLGLEGAPSWLAPVASILGIAAVMFYIVVINKAYRQFW